MTYIKKKYSQNKKIVLLKNNRGFIHFAVLGCLAGLIVFGLVGLVFIGVGLGGQKSSSSEESNWTGSEDTSNTSGDLTLPATSGKLGYEEHVPGRHNQDNQVATDLSCMLPPYNHYQGADSNPLTYPDTGNCAAYFPHTTEQEQWYFNMRWPSSEFKHKKIILTNPQNGKRAVVSIEEYGPAAFVTKRDGVNCGAPPEVRNYLQTESPYTGNPSDGKGLVYIGFANDQNIPLGPLPDTTPIGGTL